jgi:hypothetical protein
MLSHKQVSNMVPDTTFLLLMLYAYLCLVLAG